MLAINRIEKVVEMAGGYTEVRCIQEGIHDFTEQKTSSQVYPKFVV